MCVEWKAKVPALARSRFVFIRLVGRHFKHNKKYVLKNLNRGKLKTRKNNEKYLSCQNRTFTEESILRPQFDPYRGSGEI